MNNSDLRQKKKDLETSDGRLSFNLSRHIDKANLRDGVQKGSAIALGYLPVGLAFGLLAKTNGFSLWETILFSFVMYSGAAQFMAIELILAGVSSFSIIVSVFLLNLRLCIMSTSLAIHTEKIPRPFLPLVGFLTTDESFSILSFNKEKMTVPFTLGVQMTGYLAWGIFSVAGFFLGEFLPQVLQLSFGVGLTCMFIALLTPSIKSDRRGLLISLITIVTYYLIQKIPYIADGWDLVIGILLGSFISYRLLKRGGAFSD